MRLNKRTSSGAWWPVSGLVLWGLCCVAFGADTVTNAVATSAPARLFEWKPFLGPFHSLVLHYPIGFLTLAVILEVYRQYRPSAEVREIIRLVVWLSLISGLFAAILGLLRATEGGYESRALDIHRVFGMLVPAVTVGTLYFQKFAYKEGGGAVMGWLYRGVLGVNFVLLAVAGHYGGNLTHGSKYLFQNAPEFMRTWLDETPEPGPATAGPGDGPGERLYATTIQGVFANKCVSCHGSEKQKGKYRMDVPEVALAGGSSGHVAIKPGDPFASDLLRRVLLPSTHDDAMPPDGKEPLNGAEIQALVQWIQLGAPFPTPAPAARAAAWQGSNVTQRPHP